MTLVGPLNVLSSLFAALKSPARKTSVELINVRASDPSMHAAIAEARGTLPIFWAKFESGDAEARNFTVKAGLTTEGANREHVWVKVLSRTGDKIVGVLDSDPQDLDDVSAGDEIVVDSDRVSDWLYERFGKIQGGYTMRALIDQMSPDKQAQLRRQLAPKPLESD